MKQIKLSCQAISWANHKIADVIKDIAELGFEGIELPIDKLLFSDLNWKEISSLLKNYNISISAIYQTLRLGNNSNYLREYEIKRCLALLTMIKNLGIEFLIVSDPPVATNNDYTILAESLEKLGSYAKSEGVRLCYHPHRGSIIEKPEQIEKLLSLTSSDNVSLCFDTGHIFWGGGDPAALLRAYIDRIAYMQMKDIRRKDFTVPEILTELYETLKIKEQWRNKLRYIGQRFLNKTTPIITETGRGEVDFESIVISLYDLNYTGWIAIEFDAPTINPKASLSRCLNKVNQYMTKHSYE